MIMKRIYLLIMMILINCSSLMAMMGQPQKGGKPGKGGGFGSLLVLFLPLLVIWYFLLIRPQQKKEKKKQKIISELAKGDKVMTIGGLYGQVVQVKESRLVIKVSEKTNVEISKTAVSGKVD